MNYIKNSIRAILLHFVLLFTNWLPDNVIFLRFRGFLANFFLMGTCKNLRIGRNVTFYNPSKIYIADDVYIAYGNWFAASHEKIIIEDEVMFGPKSIIVSGNHTLSKGSYRYGKTKGKSIIIKKGAWIGGNCSILAGSEIGSGTAVGANSVTSKKIPSNSVYVGTRLLTKKNN